MDDLRFASLRRLNLGFQLLIGVALAAIVFVVLSGLFREEFRVGFDTVRGLEILTQRDLAFSQRAVIVGIAALPQFCWMYSLVQLFWMSLRFRRGEVLSEAVISRFQRFGRALGAMAVTEAVAIPAIAAYLIWLGKIAPLERWWPYVFRDGALNSLVAAVLVLIVARILRIAMQIEEESRLTV